MNESKMFVSRNILRLSITSDLEMAIENISNSSFNSFSMLFMSVMITNHVGTIKQQNNIKTSTSVYLFSRTYICRWNSTTIFHSKVSKQTVVVV